MRPASRIFTLCLLGLLVVSTLGTAWVYWQVFGPAKMFGDFPVFYAAGQHVMAGDLKAVYDVDHLRHLLETDSKESLSFFLNPPTALFLVYPLGFTSEPAALALWSLLQIALLIITLRTDYMRRLFASAAPHTIPVPLLLTVTFSTFCLQNLFYGQAAMLCAVLFLLVVALRRSQPILAGVLLGLFSFKPQLAVLLPILLIMEKNGKTLLAAIGTTAIMVLLSIAVFGISLWHDYFTTLDILRGFLVKDQPALFAMTTSTYAAMRNLGTPAGPAMGIQAAMTVVVLIYSLPALVKASETIKIQILILATYLVSPYSLLYDMCLIAVPCALLMRRAEADTATRGELYALLLLIMLPVAALLLQINHIPYSVIAIGLALIVARRLVKRETNG